jgi:adenylosuccinate lyase
VWPAVIASHIEAEIPFMATEIILMQCVKAGGDRQILHEAIRQHSMEAGRRVKEEGVKNDLLERISSDHLFSSVHPILAELVDPAKFIGRCPQQVIEFLSDEVDPILQQNCQRLEKVKFDEVNV